MTKPREGLSRSPVTESSPWKGSPDPNPQNVPDYIVSIALYFCFISPCRKLKRGRLIPLQVLAMCCNAEEIKDYLKYFLIICRVSRDKGLWPVSSAGFYQCCEGRDPTPDPLLITNMLKE